MESNRTIQVLKNMFQAYVIDFGGQSYYFIALEEIEYNNSYY